MKANDQLFINSKWYFDVIEVLDNKVKVRVKYYEGPDTSYYLYKNITLPIDIFTDITQDKFIYRSNIDQSKLKDLIGNLVTRLVKEQDIISIVEDSANCANTSGMGAVANPGMSGTPGVTGSAGSGDVGSFLPKNTYGLEISPKINSKHRKQILKKNKQKPLVDNSSLNLSGYRNVIFDTLNETKIEQSDNDYKTKLYQFLDYPVQDENDIKFIRSINQWRPDFLTASSERIKQYFKDLYKANKTLIKNKCSEWFQNNILILADITE